MNRFAQSVQIELDRLQKEDNEQKIFGEYRGEKSRCPIYGCTFYASQL